MAAALGRPAKEAYRRTAGELPTIGEQLARVICVALQSGKSDRVAFAELERIANRFGKTLVDRDDHAPSVRDLARSIAPEMPQPFEQLFSELIATGDKRAASVIEYKRGSGRRRTA